MLQQGVRAVGHCKCTKKGKNKSEVLSIVIVEHASVVSSDVCSPRNARGNFQDVDARASEEFQCFTMSTLVHPKSFSVLRRSNVVKSQLTCHPIICFVMAGRSMKRLRAMKAMKAKKAP